MILRRFKTLVFLFVFACGGIFADFYDPIAVYLTWQHSPQSTMTVQWISGNDRHESIVEYRRENDSLWQKAQGSHSPMPDGHPYLIHRVELINLEPATEYYFRTGIDAVSFKFQTMPKELKEPVRFIAGGDIYHGNLADVRDMNIQAAKTDPMFALVGGDIAYAVDKLGIKPQRVDRWLNWLIAWKEDMVTSDGKLIPMLPTIGNHDTNGDFGQTPAKAPFFMRCLPCQVPRDIKCWTLGTI